MEKHVRENEYLPSNGSQRSSASKQRTRPQHTRTAGEGRGSRTRAHGPTTAGPGSRGRRVRKRSTRSEILTTEEDTNSGGIGEMNGMQDLGAQRGIGGAEVDGKIKLARAAATDSRHVGGIVVAVETDIGGGEGQGREGVHFVVGPVGGFPVDGDGLDDVGAADVVGARRADRVVAAVEGHRVVGRAAPGEVFVRPDYRHDLRVRVGHAVDYRVRARVVAGVAAVGGAGVVLGLDDRCRCCEEQGGEEGELHLGWMGDWGLLDDGFRGCLPFWECLGDYMFPIGIPKKES